MGFKEIILLIAAVFCLFFGSGCGGGSVGGGGGHLSVPPLPAIKGTVAKGYALTNTAVALLDQNSNQLDSGMTDSQGRYRFAVPKAEAPYIVRALNISSLVATKPQTDRIVNLNDITTFTANNILNNSQKNITEAEIRNTGQQIVNKVLGGNTSFEQFYETEFVARVSDSDQKPSVSDLLLDGMNDTALDENKTVYELLQERYISTDICIKPLLADDRFKVNFGANILTSGYTLEEADSISSAIYSDSTARSVMTSLTDSLNNLISDLGVRNNRYFRVSVQSLQQVIGGMIIAEIQRANVCQLSELGAEALQNLVSNVTKVMREAVIDAAEEAQRLTQNEEQAKTIIVNTQFQASSVLQQLQVTSSMDGALITSVSAAVNSVATEVTRQFQQVLSSTPTISATAMTSAVNTTNVATMTLAIISELRTQVSTESFRTTTSTTEELILIGKAPEPKVVAVAVPPVYPPQGVLVGLERLFAGEISGTVTVQPPRNTGDIDSYNLYWGNDSGLKIKDDPFIGSIVPSGQLQLRYTFPEGTRVPQGATHVLVYSANDEGGEMSYPVFISLTGNQVISGFHAFRQNWTSSALNGDGQGVRRKIKVDHKILFEEIN